jgi:hypothetical protein
MRWFGSVCAAAVLATTLGACGQDKKAAVKTAHASKVALTIDWPGVAPWALITYTGGEDKRCAALGRITGGGPRVLGALDLPLNAALAARGRCLDHRTRPVLLEIRESDGREARIIGGLADRGVKRLRIAGQTVRPNRDGAFLLLHADAATTLGRDVKIEFHGGGSSTMKLPSLQRT